MLPALLQAVVSFRRSKCCLRAARSVGYVHPGFSQQKPGHQIPPGISTQCGTYISVCVETLICSSADSELQSPMQHGTGSHHDFTSDGTTTLSVDKTCCPFQCWRTEETMSFIAMREILIDEKHILNPRSMRSKASSSLVRIPLSLFFFFCLIRKR